MKINNYDVFIIDSIPTIITQIHESCAKGYILQSDFTFESCYVIKQNNMFAHGKTLKDARDALLEKMYDGESISERIKRFVDSHDFEKSYKNTDFFIWHHVLTGSCKLGRETFVKDHGIDLNGEMTTKDFLNLTLNNYGGDIIQKTLDVYNH